MGIMDSITNFAENSRASPNPLQPAKNSMDFMDVHGESVVKTFIVAALVYAGASGAIWGAEGGSAFGAPYGGGEEFGVMGEAAGGGSAAAGGSAEGASTAVQVADTGVATSPNEALVYPDSGETTTGFTQTSSVQTPNSPTTTPQAPSSNVNVNENSTKGLVDSIMNWGSKNPWQAAGLLQVAGGIGQNITQNEIMDKRVEGDKALLAQKTEEERKAAENKRKLIQSGSYFTGSIPIAGGDKVLRRPDGTLVYGPNGIINTARGGQ